MIDARTAASGAELTATPTAATSASSRPAAVPTCTSTASTRHRFAYTNLTHGTTDHGHELPQATESRRQGQAAQSDFSRLATTYYHRSARSAWRWRGSTGSSNSAAQIGPRHDVEVIDCRPGTGMAPMPRLPRPLIGQAAMPISAACSPHACRWHESARGRLVGAALRHHRPGHRHHGLLRAGRSSTCTSTRSTSASAATRCRIATGSEPVLHLPARCPQARCRCQRADGRCPPAHGAAVGPKSKKTAT